MLLLRCITCEGSGTVRQQLNSGGDYKIWHCRDCQGQGERYYATPSFQPEPKPAAPSKPFLDQIKAQLDLAKQEVLAGLDNLRRRV